MRVVCGEDNVMSIECFMGGWKKEAETLKRVQFRFGEFDFLDFMGLCVTLAQDTAGRFRLAICQRGCNSSNKGNL